MNDKSAPREAPSWYPWLVAVVGMLTLFLSNGMTATGVTIFDSALLDEFGWDRGPFKFTDTIKFVLTALMAPFVGILIDKVNPRWLLMTGCALLTLGYLGYAALLNGAAPPVILLIATLGAFGLAAVLVVALGSLLPQLGRTPAIAVAAALALVFLWKFYGAWSGDALRQLYAIHMLFALALSAAGSMTVIFLVSSWFVKHRGLAIGIALIGTSLGSAVFPLVNPPLIEAFGWRQAFTWNAAMPVVLLVLVAIAIKGTPAQAGYRAVGQSAAVADLKQHGLTFKQALRTRTFWAIAVSGFLAYYSIFSFVQHFVLHLNKGFAYTLADAGKMMFLFSLVAMTAKFAIGWLADHIDRHKVFTACQVIMLVGMIGLASMEREWVVASAVIIGLGWGGLFTLYNMLAVNNFGLREIGRINGSISLMESIGVGLGSWVTGLLFDRYGSYQVPFTVLAVAIVVALLVGLLIRSEVDERVVAER
ncbi:MAG: MFS transporter [Gammaproteobacteria bacterium]|jgi:sugar phosphate permease